MYHFTSLPGDRNPTFSVTTGLTLILDPCGKESLSNSYDFFPKSFKILNILEGLFSNFYFCILIFCKFFTRLDLKLFTELGGTSVHRKVLKTLLQLLQFI